jgi:hypothetical protein
MYIVISGSPRYHLEDDRFTTIRGVFDNKEDARQCFHFFKGECGDIVIMEVPFNKPVDLNFGVYGDNCPPLPREKGDLYIPFWVVSRYDREFKTICYGVRSTKDAGMKLKEEVSKKFEVDTWNLDVRKYVKLDLEQFDFNEDIIDKEIEPIRLEKTPYFFRVD